MTWVSKWSALRRRGIIQNFEVLSQDIRCTMRDEEVVEWVVELTLIPSWMDHAVWNEPAPTGLMRVHQGLSTHGL